MYLPKTFIENLLTLKLDGIEESKIEHKIEELIKEKGFYILWSGGGGSPSHNSIYLYTPESEPNFESLNNFLIKFYPNLSMVAYLRILESSTVNFEEKSYPYETATFIEGKKEMLFEKLAFALINEGLLESENFIKFDILSLRQCWESSMSKKVKIKL